MSKPKFDPNKEVNSVESVEEKPKFNPKKEFAVPELESPIASGVGGLVTEPLALAGEVVDQYISAPTRSAFGKILDINESYKPGENLSEASAEAFTSQFGQDPSLAPTNEDLTKSVVMGKSMEGMSPEERLLVKRTSDVLMPAVTDLPASMAISGAAEGAGTLARAAGGAIKSAVVTGSGLTEKTIDVYKNRPKQVEKFVQSYGNDDVAAAKATVEKIRGEIITEKNALNEKISKSLSSHTKRVVSTEPAEIALEAAKESLDPDIHQAAIAEIDNQLGLIRKMKQRSDDGLLTLKEAHALKEDLQKKSYWDMGKEIFSGADDAERAMKSASAEMRNVLNASAPQDYMKANQKLSALHDVDDELYKVIKDANGLEGRLTSIGQGDNRRAVLSIKQAERFTGKEILPTIEEYSAYRNFLNPGLTPKGPQTGAMVAKQMIPGGIGATVGGFVGNMVAPGGGGAVIGASAGGTLGAMATSPAVVKKGINLMNAAERTIGPAVSAVNKIPNKSVAMFNMVRNYSEIRDEIGETTEIPPQMRSVVISELSKFKHIPPTERAKMVDEINRTGKISKPEVILEYERMKWQRPEPQTPKAPTIDEVRDRINQRTPPY